MATGTAKAARAFADIKRIPPSSRYHIDVMETLRHYRLSTSDAVEVRTLISRASREPNITAERSDDLVEARRITNSYVKDIRLRATGPTPDGPNPHAPRSAGPTASRMAGS
jgi:hypothetical protein